MHINPRIKDKALVRNSKIGGNWGVEEREVTFNPFGPGTFFDVSGIYIHSETFGKMYINKKSTVTHSVFQMTVTCDSEKFRVSVDGKHVFDYAHRVTPSSIDKLAIVGDVEFSYISF